MSDEPKRATSVRRYVFYNEHRPSRAWMPTLELINERFSQQLRAALLQYLRAPLEITPPAIIELIKYHIMAQRLAMPSYLCLVSFKPLRGMMLFVVDAQLVRWIIESRFGGDGRFPVTNRNPEFSRFEQKSTLRVVQTAIEQFALAWQPIAVLKPQIVGHETNLQMADVASAGEYTIISQFQVSVGPGGGKLTICIPHVMLEPLHHRLVSDSIKARGDHDPLWRDCLTASVGRATVPLNVDLAKIEVTVADLLRLGPGTVFEIDRPETVTIELNGVPLFRGRWGKHGRKLAVRIVKRLQSAVDVLGAELSQDTSAGGNGEQ
jgi:flagellar motor switch protein FliM